MNPMGSSSSFIFRQNHVVTKPLVSDKSWSQGLEQMPMHVPIGNLGQQVLEAEIGSAAPGSCLENLVEDLTYVPSPPKKDQKKNTSYTKMIQNGGSVLPPNIPPIFFGGEV